ncbi:MAG: hypothetical protein ABI321_22375 [Polyangia bacterium]
MAAGSPASTAFALLAIAGSLCSVALVSWPLVQVGFAAAAGSVLVAAYAARRPARVLTSVALLLALAVLGGDVLLVLAAR